ncbi:MAG: response regulator transcription factor [Lachnospiraceae bacterium]|nr:response regulator transcription factor [Lachnospiraceae bacterium]
MADIIVVEDNQEIGILLQDFLIAEGYDTYLSETGEECLEVLFEEGAKLVILDIMLPGIDGFAVCKAIRDRDNTPIIIVSAKDTKEDKLKGIMLGADDYIEKPYDIDILLAKISGIFKRRYSTDEMICGDIKLDKVGRKVYKAGEEKSLNAKEYALLLYMMENKDKVISKDELFNKIWGFDSDSEPQTLTVHVKWLREKLEDDPKKPTHIQTVWGVGYRFE